MRLFGLGSPRPPVLDAPSPGAPPPPLAAGVLPDAPLEGLPRAHRAAEAPTPWTLSSFLHTHRAPVAAVLLGTTSLVGLVSSAIAAPAVVAAPDTTLGGARVTRPEMMTQLARIAEGGVSADEVAKLKDLLADARLTPGARDAITVLLSKSGQASVEAGRTHSLGAGSKVEPGTKGAYFRKLSSEARVEYRGIRAEGHLPVVHFDAARFYTSKNGVDHFETGPLDRPSIYLGGRTGGVEMDVGLTWDRVYDGKTATYTDRPDLTDGRDAAHRFVRGKSEGQPAVIDGHGKVVALGPQAVAEKMKTLTPNYAFRPVWRAISEGKNDWGTPPLGSADNVYFYPGERFDMRVEVVGKNKVELAIASVDVEGGVSMSHTFAQDGAGIGKKQSFKRVSSVDQFFVQPDGSRKGREKLDVLPTRTMALGGGWDSVEILSKSGPVAMRGKSMTEVKGGDTAGRYESIFHRYGMNVRGGERIDIIPPQR